MNQNTMPDTQAKRCISISFYSKKCGQSHTLECKDDAMNVLQDGKAMLDDDMQGYWIDGVYMKCPVVVTESVEVDNMELIKSMQDEVESMMLLNSIQDVIEVAEQRRIDEDMQGYWIDGVYMKCPVVVNESVEVDSMMLINSMEDEIELARQRRIEKAIKLMKSTQDDSVEVDSMMLINSMQDEMELADQRRIEKKQSKNAKNKENLIRYNI